MGMGKETFTTHGCKLPDAMQFQTTGAYSSSDVCAMKFNMYID
jgi:hypothetical protein